ncbi:response regulator [Dictyobacter kobayashii]|uniref:DNA-binding response regulator n=1 Tax=Dictyobacter kobayashii TaxID=2014872 RepID=A0A402AH84_9CHLR|nr:response regulator transcription factor [Dictyobacter kobayashii]GCE18478.1 DNA-binding response regulator [Dictyobacter kobayashii]
MQEAGEGMITVLLVDDHKLVRQGVRIFLELQPDIEVLAEADNGEMAIQLVQELQPAIVLMDMILPAMNGIEATRRIKQVSPDTKIVILTSFHEDEYIFPALRAGALSYVLKDVGPDELADAIRKAARDESVLHPRVAARVVQEIQGTKKEARNLGADLSERELDVLRLIAAGQSNAEIAEKLVISEKTVKGHVSNILGKLHTADRTQAAVYAWEHGIVQRKQTPRDI